MEMSTECKLVGPGFESRHISDLNFEKDSLSFRYKLVSGPSMTLRFVLFVDSTNLTND